MKRLLLCLLFSITVVATLDSTAQVPTLLWASRAGGTGDDPATSVAVDVSGHAYVAGHFNSAIMVIGTTTLSNAGGSDIFLAKYDAAGGILWATSIGGTGADVATAIALDTAGNVYTTGYFSGTVDFDPGAGAHPLSSTGNSVFILKLDTSGAFVWAKSVGRATASSVAVDASGNVYTTGSFSGCAAVDFDPGPEAYFMTSAGNPSDGCTSDLFVSKLDSAGGFLWAWQFGGVADDSGISIATDADQNVHVTGTHSTNTPSGSSWCSSCYNVNIVLKLDAFGALLWQRQLGGADAVTSYSIALDASGSVYTAGQFTGTVDFDPGAGSYELTTSSYANGFVSKLDAAGDFVWAKALGGSGALVIGNSIAVDSSGSVHATGTFEYTADFDPGLGVFDLTANWWDVFLFRLDPSGQFVWARSMGGTDSDSGNAIALDPSGTVYAAGYFRRTVDFDPDIGDFLLTSAGGSDAFLLKLGSLPSHPTLLSPGSATESQAISTVTPTFQWTPGHGATRYAMTISAWPYGWNSVVYSNASVSGTSLTLPPGVLVNSGRYRWEMTAYNSAGESVVSPSLYFQVVLPGIPPLSAPPVALSPGSGIGPGSALDTSTPTFRWTASTGTSTYGLRISRSPFGPGDVIYSNLAIAGTSFPLPGSVLTIGTQYRWNVTAINSGGESAASNAMYFVLRDSPSVLPAAPSGLTATWVNASVGLAWKDMSSNESGFKIERRDASGPYSQITSTSQNANIFTDTTASTTVDHCFRVRATNGAGDSAYSNESCIAPVGAATASQHLQFSSAAYPAGPSGASVTITRSGGTSGTVAATVLVSQGTAVAGWDYSTLGPVAVTFAPGETSKTVTVLQVLLQRVDDRTVNLALTGPTGDATLGSPRSAVMTIQGTSSVGTISIQDPVCIQTLNHCAGGGLLTTGYPDPAKLAQLRSATGAAADGVTLLVLGVASSTPITFSLSRPSPQYGTLMQLDGSGSAQSITVAPIGSTAFAVYKVPIDLAEEVPLSVTATNSVGAVIANRTFDLRHPPVVFIHGLWSSPNAFRVWENLLRMMGYAVAQADYSANAAETFNPFDSSVPISALVSGVEEALGLSRGKGIAASQVDVVAHSMGGLVARAREQDRGPRIAFKRKENRYRGEFHKLITIGTPHQGSPFADYLAKYKCWPIGTAVTVSHHSIGQAIYDLQTTSRTLFLLRSTVVPGHAIVGRKPASSATEHQWNLLLFSFGESLDGILGSDGQHDTVVRVVSQRGGLTDGTTATTVEGVIHSTMPVAGMVDDGITETTAPEVFGLVLQLLAAPVSPDTFGSVNPPPVFVPTGQEFVNVPCFGLALKRAASGGATLTPAPATVVRPGEVIHVVFSVPVSAASTSAMVSIGGRMIDVTGSAGSFLTSYQLPPDVTGRITISATTLDLGEGNLSSETYVVALPSAPPAALAPSPGSVEFAVTGLTTKLAVIGMYGDGATADLTSSASGTAYSTLSGTGSVVTVSVEGVVQAVANGQDTIVIQNGGQTASVTATVNITNQRPTLAALTDTSVAAGQTLAIPLTASDPDFNDLQLSATGLPAFVTLVDNHNGTGVLSVQPSAMDVGTYPIYISVVDDGNPALGLSRSFQLTVAMPTLWSLTVTKDGTGSGQVFSTPVGISCGAACGAPFASGAVVTLTAVPDADSSFAGWSGGGCSGTGTCAVTMSSAQAVTATFTLAPVLPQITYFTATPAVRTSAGASTLAWTTTGATSVAISGLGGTFALSGTRDVSVGATTTYTLTATNGAGSVTALATVNVLPGAGTSLGTPVITAPSGGQTVTVAGVGFTWNAVASAAGYDVKLYSATSGATVFAGSLVGNASTSTLVTLPDGAYLFAVRACNASGFASSNCGAFATRGFSVSQTSPTGAPTVTAPAQGAVLTASTQIFSWTAVPSVDPGLSLSYEVLLTDVAGGNIPDLQITVPDPTLSTIYTLHSSALYELKVRACQAGCGPWSDPVTFSVDLPDVPTTAPSVPTCSVSGGNSLTCSWSAVSGADVYSFYVVQPTGGPGGGALSVATRLVSETTVTLPVPQGFANVIVAACTGDGCGPYSGARGINPSGPNPSSPNLGTPLAASVVNGPGVEFSWNRIPGDDGTNTWYRLYVQDLSRQAAALDVYTQDNFYAAYFKAEGARYDALVVANPGLPTQVVGPPVGFNVGGLSANAPTMVSPPYQSTLQAGNLQLGWSPVPGGTLYQYWVAVLGQGTPVVTGVTPGLVVQVPLPAEGGVPTTYSGITRACMAPTGCSPTSDAGWGPWSNAPGGPGVTNFTVVP
jgi:pimeloyl-ACP methyl ester carboxylesterase